MATEWTYNPLLAAFKNENCKYAYRVCSFWQLESGTVEIYDPELNEQLSLSTADLRFADYLIHHVNDYVEKGEQDAGQLHSVQQIIIVLHG